ncbi:MAG TPA: hypothetical protein VN756_12850 [Solirubrobacterales bacterium]|nr:hypothetical protein [Solirubrobacterales bacterium]
MSQKWEPAMSEVTWTGTAERLDGEHWPDEVVLEAWERNDRGERRIRATRSYRLLTDDTEDER